MRARKRLLRGQTAARGLRQSSTVADVFDPLPSFSPEQRWIALVAVSTDDARLRARREPFRRPRLCPSTTSLWMLDGADR